MLGVEADTLEVVDRVGAEVVAVASGPSLAGQPLRRLGWALEQRNVDLLIDPGVIEVAGPRLTLRRASGLPMLHVERPVCSGARYAVKLAVDRLIALVSLVLGAPLLLAIALLVKRDSPGPVLYGQRRVGEGGRTFTMLKFRTMCADADAVRDALESQERGPRGPVQAAPRPSRHAGRRGPAAVLARRAPPARQRRQGRDVARRPPPAAAR